MNLSEITALAAAAGLGGVAGATLAVLGSGSRLISEWDDFAEEASRFFESTSDPAAMELKERFESMDDSIRSTESAIKRLRRALKLK